MPTENQTKPCGVTGRTGTIVFERRAVPPGGNASFPRLDGASPFVEPMPAWVCDKDHQQAGKDRA